ncbi:hypothetical protein KQS06HV_100188 [Klebsiella quasipneumoniae subsp. similipneumoniae]|nr:hypothetical protein KQS06HV_100188 [Klebsiella quasipneumoniae subsp. similipneumoniae]
MMRRRRCRTSRRYCRKISVNEKGPLRAYFIWAILPAILKLGSAQTACDKYADWDNLSVGFFIFRRMIKVILFIKSRNGVKG